MTTLTLRILNGQKCGQSEEVIQSGYQIGRSHDMQLQLTEKTISGHHLELLYINDVWYVRNYSQSEYGTKLSGRLMKHEEILPLKAGDLLELNKTVLIGVEDTGHPKNWSFYMNNTGSQPQDTIAQNGYHAPTQNEGTATDGSLEENSQTDTEDARIPSHQVSSLKPIPQKNATNNAHDGSTRLTMRNSARTLQNHEIKSKSVEDEPTPPNIEDETTHRNVEEETTHKTIKDKISVEGKHEDLQDESTPHVDVDEPTPNVDQDEPTPHIDEPSIAQEIHVKNKSKILSRQKTAIPQTSNNDEKTTIASDENEEKTTLLIQPGNDPALPPQFIENTKDKILRYSKYVLLLILFGMGLRFMWMQAKNRKEQYITWPLDSKGALAYAVYKTRINGIGIIYPNWEGGVQIAESEDKKQVEIITRAGKNWDVPFRIIIDMSQNQEHLLPSRRHVLEDWANEKNKNGWKCGSVFPETFLQANTDGGIPNLKIEYSRTANEIAWCGIARLIRYCGTACWVLCEMPSSEDSRRILPMLHDNNPIFVDIKENKEIICVFWDSTGDLELKAPLEEMRQQAEEKLEKHEENSWPELENLLSSCLIRAKLDKDMETFDSCQKLWKEYRLWQRKWINEQIIKYQTFMSQNKEKEMEAIRLNAMEKFRNLKNDRRGNLLRDESYWIKGR